MTYMAALVAGPFIAASIGALAWAGWIQLARRWHAARCCA